MKILHTFEKFETALNEVDSPTDGTKTDPALGAETLKDIIELPYAQFIQKLTGVRPPETGEVVAKVDDKVAKILSLGKDDMEIEDEQIPVNDKALPPVKDLFPTQAQIGLLDSIGFSAFVNPESSMAALSGEAKFKDGERILTANNKYILDGHHRWSQTYLLNPEAKIPALDLTLNVKDENEMLKVIQMAIAATYGSISMKSANAATDIFDNKVIKQWNDEYKIKGDSSLGLVKAVLDGKCTIPKGGNLENVEKFIEIVKVSKGLADREAVEKYLASNADLLRQGNSKPVEAPPRSIMPQPGDTAKALRGSDYEKIVGIPAEFVNKMKSGELNYKPDFIKKESKLSFPISLEVYKEKNNLKQQEMKKVKNFDQYLFEMESAEMTGSFESPEASGATVSVEDYQDQKGESSMSKNSKDAAYQAYLAGLKAVAAKYKGKKFGTPGDFGAVQNPHWIIESFADVAYSLMGGPGAGLMLRAKRAEGKGQGGDWNVTVFIGIDVTKNLEKAKFSIKTAFPSGTEGKNIPAPTMSKGGYYGAVDVMKRIGLDDMDVQARSGFTTSQLEKHDPAWSPLFRDIEAVATKYGS